MNVREALRAATRRLSKFRDHQNSAALDAELLLAHALRVPREALYTHPERVLTTQQDARLRGLLQRRARREPVAYILGEKEFYGLKLRVTPDVLIPRPETEELVEAALSVIASEAKQSRNSRLLRRTAPRNDVTLIDVGTGSGAIAIALARSFAALRMTINGKMTPFPKIIATDVSRSALAVARSNARRHEVADRITFIRCDLLPSHPNPLPRGEGVVIVANLPYLPTKLWRATTPEIKKYEPRSALDGGKDGLDVYRRLLDQIPPLHLPPANRGEKVGGSWVLLAEMLPSHMRRFSSEVLKRFPHAHLQRVAPMIIQVKPALN